MDKNGIRSLTDISYIRELMSSRDTGAKKKFGQNFLVNAAIPARIAREGVQCGEGVLEIGPGIGVLTRELSARAGNVVAVEIDEDMVAILGETLQGYDNVEVVHGDILRQNLATLVDSSFPKGSSVSVCANLPYYVTTPVLMYLLESSVSFRSITVMVQKEVADRLCAMPGTAEYGAVTVAVAFRGLAEKLFPVASGNFFPAPKVDSCVVRINCYEKNPYTDCRSDMFRRVVRAAFAQRRKTLANTLSSEIGVSKSVITDMLVSLGIRGDVRGECLSCAQFCDLTAALQENAG